MPEIPLITSRTHAQLAQVLHLRKQRGRNETGLFIAEGVREVSRAIAAKLKLHQLYYCPAYLPSWPSGACGPWPAQGAKCFELGPFAFDKIAYRDKPEGVIGIFGQRSWSVQQAVTQFDQHAPSTDHANVPRPELWLVAVGFAKPGNIGALARTALGAGVTGLLLADSVADRYNPNAIRASTGAVFALPMILGTSAQVMAILKERQLLCLGGDPGAKRCYTDVSMTKPIAIVIGPEDVGLDHAWRQMLTECGQLVGLPIAPQSQVDSLNASVCAGILLYEAIRQRSLLS